MLQQQEDFFIGFHYSMKLHNFLRAAQLLGRFGFLFKVHHWLLQNGLQCKMRLMSTSRGKDLSKTSSAQSDRKSVV